jgi:hypothetical protein
MRNYWARHEFIKDINYAHLYVSMRTESFVQLALI